MARASSSASASQILFVKRKTAHLDYLTDPHGSRSLSSRAVETAPMDVSADATELIGPGVSELREVLRGFLDAGKQRELVRALCLASASSQVEDAGEPDPMTSLMRTVVMECLTMDKMYLLPAYASIVQLRQKAESSSTYWLRHSRDVRFANDFYQHHFGRLFAGSKELSLVQPALLSSLRRQAQHQAKDIFDSSPALRDAIAKYVMLDDDKALDATLSVAAMEDFWSVWVASEMPSAKEVRGLVRCIRDHIRTLAAAGGTMEDLKSRIRLVTDAAFGGASRPPWTSYILDHVVDRLLSE